jgi:RHH-type transcriptional regulator, rel operon repressor / antitoxin RelB
VGVDDCGHFFIRNDFARIVQNAALKYKKTHCNTCGANMALSSSSIPSTAKTATLNLRLPELLLAQLDQLASATQRSKTFLATEALKDYLEAESWQIQDIRQGVLEADAGDFASDAEVQAVFAKYGA